MLNMQNYLIKSLAVVGTISLIIMACSADEANNSNDPNGTNSTNAVGKYQISAPAGFIHILNTETGVVKTYRDQSINGATTGTWVLWNTITANH